MVFDSRIQTLKDEFGIAVPEDWQDVEPGWILRQRGVGQVTLDHIRMYLAMRGLALKNDRTPEYWKTHLSNARIGHTLGNEEFEPGADSGIICPFTILIDTAEQNGFTFLGLRGDADQRGRPLIVPTERRALGRHPDSMGDYSVDGFVGRVAVERKSLEDLQGTLLAFSGRRERFETELDELGRIEAAMVVVECSYERFLAEAPATSHRGPQENAKTLNRSVLAMLQDYGVPIHFAGSRRIAEMNTFYFLKRFWEKQNEQMKRESLLLATHE